MVFSIHLYSRPIFMGLLYVDVDLPLRLVNSAFFRPVIGSYARLIFPKEQLIKRILFSVTKYNFIHSRLFYNYPKQ